MNTYEELESLPKTKWNIPQPSETDQREDCLQIGGLDLILTPGLAFTKEGHRLGRGKGFYDKFFVAYNSLYKPPHLIGLALNPSIVDDIPYTLNDVKMDEVLYANH
jgi:5-formyltetrahydrofolate cyclo-ligase